MKQSLPGITAIRYLECSKLPSNLEMKSLVGVPIGIYDIMTSVCFTGHPTCITESEYDQHAQSEKTVLTFQTTDELPVRRQLAFVVSDIQGRLYLIGHNEAPYPTVKRTGQLGTPAEEKAGYTYEVTLIGRKTLIKLSQSVDL